MPFPKQYAFFYLAPDKFIRRTIYHTLFSVFLLRFFRNGFYGTISYSTSGKPQRKPGNSYIFTLFFIQIPENVFTETLSTSYNVRVHRTAFFVHVFSPQASEKFLQ